MSEAVGSFWLSAWRGSKASLDTHRDIVDDRLDLGDHHDKVVSRRKVDPPQEADEVAVVVVADAVCNPRTVVWGQFAATSG